MKMARRSWLVIGLVSVALLTLPLTAQAKNPKPSAYDLILQGEIDDLNAKVNNLQPPTYSVVHGHSGHIQDMTVVLGAAFGWGLTFAQLPEKENWVHFSIPLSQFQVHKIMLKFLAGARVTVDQVGIWNGDVAGPILNVPAGAGNDTPVILNLPTPMVFDGGLGISVHVMTGAAGSTNALDYTINFSSAGALFTD